MRYIISENKILDVVKRLVQSYYGNIEMTTDEDGYLNFFSEKDINNEGYPKRIFHRNLYGTLWVDYEFYRSLVDFIGNEEIVNEGIKKYLMNKVEVPVKQVNIEF